jgi:hypothetical protein
VGTFDSSEEHPHSKIRRYIITGLAFVALAALGCWYLLRYHTEKTTVHRFLDAVIAGRMQDAYRIWKPSSAYSYPMFLEDWGPNGYYGPVKSYKIEDATGRGPVVVIVVDVNPYQPFPNNNDVLRQSKTKEVSLWVELKSESISIAPY